MSKKVPLNPVEEWLLALMHRCQVSMTAEESETTARAFAPAFQDAFPLGAFSPQSLNAVGNEVKYFNQANAHIALAKWWDDHRPVIYELPSWPADPLMTDEELADGWNNPAVILRKIGELRKLPASSLRQALLSMIRSAVTRFAPEYLEMVPETLDEPIMFSQPEPINIGISLFE